jgi:hypothetical protein
MRPGGEHQKLPAGCVCEWLATECPRATMARMRSGCDSANMPLTKNVAFTP